MCVCVCVYVCLDVCVCVCVCFVCATQFYNRKPGLSETKVILTLTLYNWVSGFLVPKP